MLLCLRKPQVTDTFYQDVRLGHHDMSTTDGSVPGSAPLPILNILRRAQPSSGDSDSGTHETDSTLGTSVGDTDSGSVEYKKLTDAQLLLVYEHMFSEFSWF